MRKLLYNLQIPFSIPNSYVVDTGHFPAVLASSFIVSSVIYIVIDRNEELWKRHVEARKKIDEDIKNGKIRGPGFGTGFIFGRLFG